MEKKIESRRGEWQVASDSRLGAGSASRHPEKGRRVPARILRGLGTMLKKMILQEVLSERKTLSPSQGSPSQSVGTHSKVV